MVIEGKKGGHIHLKLVIQLLNEYSGFTLYWCFFLSVYVGIQPCVKTVQGAVLVGMCCLDFWSLNKYVICSI